MTEAPFDPPSMPSISSTNKMFYISMSDYVFNSLAYEAQIHKMLQYNLTQKDVSTFINVLNVSYQRALSPVLKK